MIFRNIILESVKIKLELMQIFLFIIFLNPELYLKSLFKSFIMIDTLFLFRVDLDSNQNTRL